MKLFSIIILTILACASYGQGKYNFVEYNKLIEIEGTDYVIATEEHWSKIEENDNDLLFINTKTGQAKQIDFAKDARIQSIKQIKMDSLGINKIIVEAKTFDFDNKGIDWSDPIQIIVFSTDGQERTQLTDNDFFVRSWVTNKQTGTIIIVGQYDTNHNNKYDKADKYEIQIFDLLTMKLKSKI